MWTIEKLKNRFSMSDQQIYRRLNAAHPIEQVGARLRAMMPWIGKNRLVDKAVN